MTTTKIAIIDVSTGETVEREMNSEELAQLEKDKANATAEAKAKAEVAAAKAELLAKLGITEKEAKLLLS